MLWDLFQQSQIGSTKRDADAAIVSAASAKREIEKLEAKVQTLSLACQAMWELLSVGSGVSEDDLKAKMNQIDLRDGKNDGRFTPASVTTCPDCGHKLRANHANCYICGSKVSISTPFTG